MKRYQCLMAAMIAVGAHGSAYATEVLNLPFSAALPRTESSYDECSVQGGYSIAILAPVPQVCWLVFPLAIPSGRTIKQINMLHSTEMVTATPFIQAWVQTQPIAAPWASDQLFNWNSQAIVPPGTVASDHLMAQWGRSFPDAFVVEDAKMYNVVVMMYAGVAVEGLQVIYE